MIIRRGNTEEDKDGNRVDKFLTFYLDEEEYGIEIHKVLEIIGMLPVTPVPRTPEFNIGVINLRGKIIPVDDLRLRLGMSATQPTSETCIIVVQANGVKKGFLVDRMSEVVDIAAEHVETPSVDSGINSRYLLGIGKCGNRIRILLNIDEILASVAIAAASSLATRVGVAIDGARADTAVASQDVGMADQQQVLASPESAEHSRKAA